MSPNNLTRFAFAFETGVTNIFICTMDVIIFQLSITNDDHATSSVKPSRKHNILRSLSRIADCVGFQIGYMCSRLIFRFHIRIHPTSLRQHGFSAWLDNTRRGTNIKISSKNKSVCTSARLRAWNDAYTNIEIVMCKKSARCLDFCISKWRFCLDDIMRSTNPRIRAWNEAYTNIENSMQKICALPWFLHLKMTILSRWHHA